MHSEGNHKQNENTTYRMGEAICKLCDQKGINFQNTQIAHTAQYKKKNKQLNQKMGRRSTQTFLQRRHTDGQKAAEKILLIIREMQIRTTTRLSPHTSQNGHHQKVYK